MDTDRNTGQNFKKKKENKEAIRNWISPPTCFLSCPSESCSYLNRRRGESPASGHSLPEARGALRWATCEGSAVSGAAEVDTDPPPPPHHHHLPSARVQWVFVNSGPVLEESVHATAVEQFKAGSPSGQGDWAVMKIPQERSEGNSVLLFVMGKRRRQGQEGRESVCVCARARTHTQVVKQSVPI